MSKVILHADSLNKSFGAVTAAKNINVEVEQGSVLGLIGTNGAGKTTFVNMITGYLKPDTGRVIFDGKDITDLQPRDITRLGICRSFQIPQLYNSMTALENLEVSYSVVSLIESHGSLFTKLDKAIPSYNKTVKALAEEALERFNLTAYRDKTARVLPGGVRKLLDIAMAMAVRPKILLLDEPTSGVSAEEKFDIMAMVMNAVKDGSTTVLFVEHDMEIVSKHADRVLAFYAGEIIADEPPEIALRDPKVIEYIVGETQAKMLQGAH
ncbi:MAG: ABC transporter ATP-binding protein [Burkholderiaceae bacterium]|nr:ABC transporter ATP-binding protein [Burkholderiaceae bacterium]